MRGRSVDPLFGHWYDILMNLNDKRLGAYKKIISPETDDLKKDDFVPEHRERQKQTVQSPKPALNARETPRPQEKPPVQDKARPSVQLPGLIKVPESGKGGKDSQYRRVAKFLLLIGVNEAAAVMSRLTQEQTEKVVLELASIRRVDKDEGAVILAEFESLIKQAREPSGGVETARNILEAAFGFERAEAMLKKAVPDFQGKAFDYLEGIDPSKLYHIITDELPAVKALVLSQLKPRLAADVIGLMSDGEKNATVIRLAKLQRIDPDVLRRVDDAIREKVKNINTTSADSIDGRSALAEILKKMDGSSEKAILEGLTDSDPELGRDLRERLFTIDDILQAADKFIQETIRPMSEHDLAVLIFAKKEDFRQKILSNVSRTRGLIITDEEKIIAPVGRAESEKVTGGFFTVMRRAWENGEFFINGRDEKEVWVE